jgi:anthranilate synthase component 2
MKILVFDNYDSFTYNLVHLVEKITHTKVDVFRNDEIALEQVAAYDKIILSPGPGIPEEAGLLLPLIKMYAATKSILGVCLGHQAIGQAFGGTLTNLSTVYHGVATPIQVVNRESSIVNGEPSIVSSNTFNNHHSPLTTHHSLFTGLPESFDVGRYHSWVVDKDNFPVELVITAEDEHGYIMALQHKIYDVQGVQFHPESVLTPSGETILRNWLASSAPPKEGLS